MRVILIRHAATDGNEQGFIQHDDIVLSANGKQQALALVNRLKEEHIEHIFSSPYTRTKMTAQVVKENHPESELHEIENLRERDTGVFRGKPTKEFKETRKREQRVFGTWKPPGGESDVEVQERMYGVFKQIADGYADNTVLIVSHGSNITNLLMRLRDMPMNRESFDANHLGNAEVTILEWRNGEAEIEVLKDRSHLDQNQ